LYAGDVEFDREFEATLESLFRQWLAPCAFAGHWIAEVEAQGHSPENLAAFRQCEAEVRGLVKFLDNDEMTDPMRRLRDRAIEEHRNGQTAEFV
jgi:hypothetical protein